jgi:hypothetical protein
MTEQLSDEEQQQEQPEDTDELPSPEDAPSVCTEFTLDDDELADDPRDDVGQEDAVAELKEHVRAAGEAIDDQDIDALRRHVRAACEVLDDEREPRGRDRRGGESGR